MFLWLQTKTNRKRDRKCEQDVYYRRESEYKKEREGDGERESERDGKGGIVYYIQSTRRKSKLDRIPR